MNIKQNYFILSLLLVISIFPIYKYLSNIKNIKDISRQTQLSQVSSSLTNGLVAYYKFDDGTGNTAVDSSGNNNNGTLTNNPTWTAGKVGVFLSTP